MQKIALKNIVLMFSFVVFTKHSLYAQSSFENSPFYKHLVTVGGSIGTAHYLGDLSPKINFRFIRPSLQVYAKKTFFPYDLSLKFNYNLSFLNAADKFSRDSMQRVRNLDFSSTVHEFSLSMQAGIVKFRRSNYTYTLYMSLGIGSFIFNPYTFDDQKKVYLRNLGTEGQFSYLPNKPAPYSLWGQSYPLGIGIQSNKKSLKTWHLEFIYRFTNTGYLDDVFSTYAGFESFQTSGDAYNSVLASKLQNRSEFIYFGSKGTSRGNGKSDHFFTLNFGMDIQLWRYIYKYRTKYKRIRINQKISPDDEVF